MELSPSSFQRKYAETVVGEGETSAAGEGYRSAIHFSAPSPVKELGFAF